MFPRVAARLNAKKMQFYVRDSIIENPREFDASIYRKRVVISADLSTNDEQIEMTLTASDATQRGYIALHCEISVEEQGYPESTCVGCVYMSADFRVRANVFHAFVDATSTIVPIKELKDAAYSFAESIGVFRNVAVSVDLNVRKDND